MARAHAYLIAVLVGSVSLLGLPQLGLAASGGASVSGGGGSSATATPRAGQVEPGNQTVSASGGGMTIVTQTTAMLNNRLRFNGSGPRSDAGKIIEIERLGPETGWAWAPTTHATVHRNGSFGAVWSTNHIGRFEIRAVIAGAGRPHAAAASPVVTVTVYRQSVATIYGPGFWGSRTACGQKLTRHMLGTANRTLKCGTEVSIYYGGRTIVVPVIDRGPYANGADWDLTEATAHALHINGTATVGAVSLPTK